MFAIISKKTRILLLLSLLAAAQLFSTLCQALKVSAHIPELVKLNDAFWLNCSHQQQPRRSHEESQPSRGEGSNSNSSESDDIYAIKWWKDEEEFYRFTPNGQPKVSTYETNGIQLDQTKSHEGNVYISKADVNSEGNYRCEILSEAPVFETVRKSKHLKVYALPVRGPRIEILDAQGRAKSPKAQEISYAVGDKIELRCNSAPSKPAARLRWYLNEHEIHIPPNNATSTIRFQPQQSPVVVDLGGGGVGGASRLKTAGASYEVRVTPMEFRQHYKSIYSSHSTLSLVLQQDDLISNKISFKCLASMRQEVPLRSKQLIVLMAPLAASAIGRREQMQISSQRTSADPMTMVALSSAEGSTFSQRQRPQSQRHSVTRLQPSTQPQQQQQQQQQQDARTKLISANNNNNNNLLFDDNEQRSMLYIYEEANAALGSTIIDTLESLESYLGAKSSDGSPTTTTNLESDNKNANYALDFAAAAVAGQASDNLEYIQLLRERTSPTATAGAATSATSRYRSGQSAAKQRLVHGASSLVKSPLYLDEKDPLRPIISWPPLESGKLQLAGNSVVAIPTSGMPMSTSKRWPATDDELSSSFTDDNNHNRPGQLRGIMLEKLLRQINCTCTEGSTDTRLNWLINDQSLDTKDTRFYPTRVSPDHRQTILTVGLLSSAPAASNNLAALIDSPPVSRSSPAAVGSQRTLKSLLNGYLAPGRHKAGQEALQSTSPPTATATTIANDQIRFACQAIHSMLLHSSSEMITFDFNPPPPPPPSSSSNLDQTNSISDDKFAVSSSNVIQATSADMESAYSLIESSLNLPHMLDNSSCPSSFSSPLANFPPSCSSTSGASGTSPSTSTTTTTTTTTTTSTSTTATVTTAPANLNHSDLEQEQHSPSLNSYSLDPFDGFSSFLLDQHYYSGPASGTNNSGQDSCDRNSSSLSSCYAMDPLDHTFSHQISSSSSPCLLMMHRDAHRGNHQQHHNYSHHHNNIISLTTNHNSGRSISGTSIDSSDNNFSFQTDPDQEDPVNNNNDLPETLTSFVADLGGVDSGDAGYNSSVDLFCSSHTSMIDCCCGGGSSAVDSPEAYYLRLALEQQQHQQQHLYLNQHQHQQQLEQNNSNNCDADPTNNVHYPGTDGQAAKRSVLMNLLINGSDVSAGYTIHNCRAQH